MMKHKNKLISISLASIMLVAMVAVVSLSASAAPAVKVAVASAPAVWLCGANPGVAVVSGTAFDGTVYLTENGAVPAPLWTSIGKPFGVTIAGDPAVTVGGAGLYVFVKDSNNAIYYTVRANAAGFAQVTGWTKLGALTVATGTSPAAYTLPAPADVNVLYVDPTTNALKNVALSTGTSTDLGGYISATPSAVVSGNLVEVFVRGQSGRLWQAQYALGGWSGWTEVPGYGYLAPGTGPAATWNPAGAAASLDVWVEGGNGSLYYQHFDVATAQWNPSPTAGATGYKLVGGVITGSPGAACTAADTICVFVKGGSNNPYWTTTGGIAYIGPPVPPATTSAGWTMTAWAGPITNVP